MLFRSALEIRANEVIFENRAITASYPPVEELEQLPYRSKKEIDGAIRVVVVDGIDICACCAPHVSRTGEIGVLKITDVKHYKGGVRLQLVCGGAAVRDYQQKQALTTHITTALSTVQEKGITAFDTYVAANDATKYENDKVLLTLADELANAHPLSEHATVITTALCGDAARQLARTVALRSQHPAVVLNTTDGGYRYTIYDESDALPSLVKAANEALDGKGGGRPPFASGTFRADADTIRRWFTENT